MADIDFVAEHYDIGKILSRKALQKGSSSNAMLILATTGKYVLRELRNEQQALAEHQLYKVLASVHISPNMLQARDGLPYILYNHKIYNLQTYIDHTIPHDQVSVDFVRLGKVISNFHQFTEHLDVPQQEDRFALPQLWSEVSAKVNNSLSEEIRALVGHTEQCMEYNMEYSAVIHGDLGIWNLLFTEEAVQIIDMGEVRRGNHHFDLAAVLTSTIRPSVTVRELETIVADFERGYVQGDAVFNRRDLFQQIHIWMLRGLLAVIRERGIVPQTIPYVRRNLEVLQTFKAILN
ncbi:phosphotransferase [Paenibacillus xylanilyticus]|uniref:phosphotransferase n=1 Tax=Paenibacillus xylanilyticus TaxID=248903 RepID=UPI00399FD84F